MGKCERTWVMVSRRLNNSGRILANSVFIQAAALSCALWLFPPPYGCKLHFKRPQFSHSFTYLLCVTLIPFYFRQDPTIVKSPLRKTELKSLIRKSCVNQKCKHWPSSLLSLCPINIVKCLIGLETSDSGSFESEWLWLCNSGFKSWNRQVEILLWQMWTEN